MDHVKLKLLLSNWSHLITDNQNYLIDLDSVAGDSDIGYVLSDGFKEVTASINECSDEDIGKLLYFAGKVLSNKAPSSMGTLLAIGLINAGKKLKGKLELDNSGILDIFEYLAEGVMQTGKAIEGEKTFLDSVLPAVRAGRANVHLGTLLMAQEALVAAKKGFENATQMVAKHGRIAFRGLQSVGIQDPGAAVGVFLIQGLVDTFNQNKMSDS